MYTRLKTPSGLKLSLNNIKNCARPLVSVSNTSTLKTPHDNGFTNIDTLIDLKRSQPIQSNSSSKASSISGSDKENNSNHSAKLKACSRNEPVFSADEKDYFVDESYVNYLNSTWKRYEKSIGLEKGPVRYEDSNTKHAHLESNFVAFDLECWWADRFLSFAQKDQKYENEK